MFFGYSPSPCVVFSGASAGGEGAPEWVPEGASSTGVFASGQYYLNGSVVEEDVFFSGENAYFGAYDPANHTEDGMVGDAPVSTYQPQINSDFLVGLGSGATLVLDFEWDNEVGDSVFIDMFSADETLWMGPIISPDGIAVYTGSGTDNFEQLPVVGRNRIAMTIISGKIAMSHNGESALLLSDITEVESPTFENQFENIGVGINRQGAGAHPTIYSIAVYPPQDDTGLAELSAL